MQLTEAERRVANGVVLGHRSKFIAAQLGKSEFTIRQQIYNICNKTGMGNRWELFRWLLRNPDALGANE